MISESLGGGGGHQSPHTGAASIVRSIASIYNANHDQYRPNKARRQGCFHRASDAREVSADARAYIHPSMDPWMHTTHPAADNAPAGTFNPVADYGLRIAVQAVMNACLVVFLT